MNTLTAERLASFLLRDTVGAETQLQRYMRMGAHPAILSVVQLGGGPAMGAKSERFLREAWPSLKTREAGRGNTGYDHRCTCPVSEVVHKLEQKTSGLWDDDFHSFKWQHIEPEHPWSGLLLVGLEPTRVVVWGMTRSGFQACRDAGLATRQGGEAGQGYWMTCRDVLPHLTPLLDESDLHAFVSCL
jgi:hypothetical protein